MGPAGGYAAPAMKDLAAFPSMVIAAYAEHLIEGRRVVVFGDSTSDLPDVLIERGARLVHVYDEDLSRVAEASARGTHKDISFAPLGQSGVLARDGAFDFGVILDVAAFEDGKKVITRLRRALAPRGTAVIATPNAEAGAPLIARGERAAGPSYYDLYEWVTAEFDEVRMLGQLPVSGYAVVDFGAEGEPDFSLDTSFLHNGAEEPDWYLALASHFPVSVDAFTIVQVPRASLALGEIEVPNAELEEMTRTNAQLEAEVARLRKVERQAQKAPKDDERVGELEQKHRDRERELEQKCRDRERELEQKAHRERELEQKCRDRERELTELQNGLADALSRLKRAETEAKETREKLALASESKAKGISLDPVEAELASAELRALERQLSERARESARLTEELRVADKLGQELLSELETTKQLAAGTRVQPEVDELREGLRRAEETDARRMADLTAAQWTIEQLRSQLQETARLQEATLLQETAASAPSEQS
jgi:hypothetical protein